MAIDENEPQDFQQQSSASPTPYGYGPVPPPPPGFFATHCVRCNAAQNIPVNNSPFYACWQCKTLNYPQQLQRNPPAKEEISKKDKRVLIVGGIAFAVVMVPVLFVVGTNETENKKIVAESQSDDPKLQAFFDRLVKNDFGTMRRVDVVKWANEACNNTDGFLGIWGDKDSSGNAYGPLDNQTFKLAALSYCKS